jgi:hypothetical protein
MKSIVLIFFLLVTTNLYAEDNKCLCVLLKSGTMIQLPVSEQPKIMFDGTLMRVGDGDYQIENVRKWMIGDPEEIAQGVENAQMQKSIEYKDGVLTVGDVQDVHVYNAAGVEMPVNIKDGKINMAAWPQDVYLIKAGKETFKIRKR